MAKKLKRDADYYRERLRLECPAIYLDLTSGKLGSVRQAAILAGMQKERSQLQVLKNAWEKASAVERKEFIRWVKSRSTPKPASSRSGPRAIVLPSAPPLTPAPSSTSARHLLPPEIDRLKDIIKRTGTTTGAVMAEMGFASRDGSLGRAIWRPRSKVRLDVATALVRWLNDHAHI